MPEKKNANAKEQLLKLEKLARRVIRKSLKDNTLDYTVQITMSSLEPSKIQYAAQITSPANGVQPITFICDSFAELEASLELAAQELNPQKVEVAFHENRINMYKSKIAQHEARRDKLNDPDYKPEDDIPMEEVAVEDTEEANEAEA